MRRGQLRYRVELQRLIAGRDAIGQPTQVWEGVGRMVYADIKYLNGLETVKADAVVDATRCSMQIEFMKDVDAGMRVKQGDKVFDVKQVLPDPTGARHLFLVCETGLSEG